MSTQVEIINLALGHISQAPITLTTDASVQAQTAMRIWDSARKEALRGHDWSFGTVVTTLTLNTTYATLTTSGLYAGEYIYCYDYPSNCLAMWHVYNENLIDKSVGEDFRELYDPINSKKVIVSNCQDALGEYTFDVTDPSFYDANFVTVLSYRLAADMAMPLTGDPQLAITMMGVFKEMMAEAERMSSYENNPDHVKEGKSAFIDARGGSTDTTCYFDPNITHPND
jgi:hypothetical protein